MDTDDIEGRFKQHWPSDTRANHHNQVRGACRTLALFLDGLFPDSREKSLAITHLEEVMFWSNAGIARQEVKP